MIAKTEHHAHIHLRVTPDLWPNGSMIRKAVKPKPKSMPLISGVHPVLHHSQEDWLQAEKIRMLMALRRAGIRDMRTLAAIEEIPREQFVEAQFRDRAYEDNALPIACEQTISMPSIVAMMTEALAVKPNHCVLEIGTGSGYQAAVLSRLARRVHTIERHAPLAEIARARFAAQKLHNIDSHLGDGSKGWPLAAPYERIIVTAAAPEIPQSLLSQLTIGGMMVIPVGPHVADQQLVRITRVAEDVARREVIAPVRFVPLVSDGE